MEDNLLKYLAKQNECSDILFPYTFSGVLLLLQTFYFLNYSIFSTVINELCMHAYVNECSFHGILLSIQIDDGKLDIMNPLDKDTKILSCTRTYRICSRGNFNHYRTI
jgi:hypothetical protein